MADKTIIRLSTKPEGFGETPNDLTPDMFASEMPTQHSFNYYTDEDLGLYIGVWDTDDMVETAGPYGCDEFMWLIEGEARIKNNRTGAIEMASAEECFVIPRGYDCQWHQKGYLRKFFVIWENPREPIPETPSQERIIIPKTNVALTAVKNSVPFAAPYEAAALQNICYTDNTDRFVSGTWQSNAFDANSQPSPHDTFGCVQTGSILFKDEEGTEHVFNAGDALFIPRETVFSTSVLDTVTVFFAIVRSAPLESG